MTCYTTQNDDINSTNNHQVTSVVVFTLMQTNLCLALFVIVNIYDYFGVL